MKRRLLILEDDLALGQMLGWELEELGYSVTLAGNCREALGQGSGFDLALLDCCLPDGSGLEVLQALRRRAPRTWVVMYSGKTCPETRTRALQGGAALFLTKPVTGGQLHRLFQRACEG